MRASCDFFISRIKCRNRIRYSRFLRGKEVLKTNFYQLASEKIFGEENIIKNADNLYITFHSEYPSWVITTFASLGEKAEIISPNSLRTEVKDFLKNALKQYEI